ncbi:MAG: 6-carboxytetrahydropterin synthase QueD [Chitinivibrionales bacterium]|nr:6-carboxytetrahydropterin synthase QueD [Chitinivibrionales bacterium]
MFEITTETHFSAAHHLRNYNGPCENIHGHNWFVRVTVRCDTLNEIGIAIDFKELKAMVNEVVDRLDHSDLNSLFISSANNPSSENIARYIYQQLDKELHSRQNHQCTMRRVDVFETPGNCASYFDVI